jgi:MFS family permease
MKPRQVTPPSDPTTVPVTAGDDAPASAEPTRRTAAAAERGGLLSVAGPRLAALLLGAACVAWSAAPLGRGGWPTVALVVAIVAVTAGGLRLVLTDVPEPENEYLLSGYMRAWLNFLVLLRTVPWEEIAVAAVLWLEVQHPARPWYTAALGAGLTAYLLITHIAESGANPARVLRRHAKLLALGACLLALGAGFAMIPAATPGAGASLLRVLAAAAVIAAAALVIPA